MRATEILKNEHRVIEQVLGCLERIAERCEEGQELDVTSAGQAIDFLRTFADRCHHGKEEDILFPMLESMGFSRELGPTGVMLHEHEQGRHHVRAMARAIESAPPDRAMFLEHARALVALLRDHINKEDHCLFPMADSALLEDDQQRLLDSFQKIEHEDLGPDTHRRYVDLANKLADRVGVRRASTTAEQSASCCSHKSGGQRV